MTVSPWNSSVLHFNKSESINNSMESGNNSYEYEYEYVYEYVYEEVPLDPLMKADINLFLSLGILILVVGTTGNLLSLCVWVCTGLRKQRLAAYMTVLAIGDLLTLNGRLLPEIIGTLVGVYPNEINAPLCYGSTYLIYVSGHLVGWSLMLMTIQKAIAVSAPLRAKRYITRRAEWITVTIMVIFILGINSHLFWTFSFEPDTNPDYPCRGNTFIKQIWSWLDTLIAVFLPFLGLIISNVIIIYKVVQSSHKRQQDLGAHTDSNLASTSTILIVLSLAFLFLNMPVQIYIYLNDNDLTDLKDYEEAFTVTTLFHLQYMNSAINFFVYCLTWKSFRRKLKLLFCRACTSRAHNSQASYTTDLPEFKTRKQTSNTQAKKENQTSTEN